LGENFIEKIIKRRRNMGKNKNKQEMQSMIDESNDSRNAKNGYNTRGNPAKQPGINNTKGKK